MRNPLNLFSPDVLKIISGDDCGKCDVYKFDSISFLLISLTLRDPYTFGAKKEWKRGGYHYHVIMLNTNTMGATP